MQDATPNPEKLEPNPTPVLPVGLALSNVWRRMDKCFLPEHLQATLRRCFPKAAS